MRDTRLMLVEPSVVEQRYQAVLAVVCHGGDVRDVVFVMDVAEIASLAKIGAGYWLR